MPVCLRSAGVSPSTFNKPPLDALPFEKSLIKSPKPQYLCKDSFDLVGAMGPLVQAIINTSVPTVVVFSSGKPITATWIDNTTASLVQQFYPSEEGGNALADILFGDVNPSGKLSVSFPRSYVRCAQHRPAGEQGPIPLFRKTSLPPPPQGPPPPSSALPSLWVPGSVP